MLWEPVAEVVEQLAHLRPWAVELLALLIFPFCGTDRSLVRLFWGSGQTPFLRIWTFGSYPISDGLFLCFFPFLFALIDVLLQAVCLHPDVHLFQEVPLFLQLMMQPRQVLLVVVHLELNPL